VNAWTIVQNTIHTVAENPLLARLTFVSFELALLAAAVALLMGLLRIRAPRVRALLWLLVLAKPILGLTIGTPLPLIHFLAPRPVAPVVSGPASVSPVETPVNVKSAAGQSNLAPAPATEPVTLPPPSPPTAPSPMPVTVPRKPLPLGDLLVGLWLLGAIGLAGLTARDQVQIRKIRRSAKEPSEGLVRRFGELAQTLQLKHCPRLRLTDALQSPGLVGFWRPDVLLPCWLAEEANPRHLDWMLRHELMHLKLNDPVALAVRRLAEILFFFHPAVWWAGKKWEEAMELACDRALLQSDADARTYAEQLYRILESQSARRRPAPLGGGLFATRTQIGKRIAALLSDPLRSPAHLSLLALGGLALVALISLPVGFGLVHAQSTKPPTEKAIPSAVTDNPASPAIPIPEGKPQPPREISDDFVFDKEIPLYVQMATADGKGNASLQWIRFARYGEYWFGERKNANNVGTDLRAVLGLANAKWRMELALLDQADSSVARVETIYEDHAITSVTRYITDANVSLMIPLPDKTADPARFRLRLEQAPADAAANAQFIYPWSSRERETKIVWGREANGLRAAIEFIPERQAYSLGEKIGVCFHVQNVGTRTLTGGLPRIAPCRAVVKDAKGNNVPTDISNLAQIAGSTEFRLAPGQEIVMRTKDLCFGARQPIAEESDHSYDVFVRSGAGRYFVQFFSSVEEVRNLEAGVREVIVVPATAAAKHLNSPVGDIRETTEIAVIGSTVSPPKTPLVWGKEVNGLRAALEFAPEKASYALGEPIGIYFHVQNVSTQTIPLSYGEPAEFAATVEDSNGKSRKVETVFYNGDIRLVRKILAPGQEILILNNGRVFKTPSSGITRIIRRTTEPGSPGSEFLIGSYFLCDGPGRYSVHYDLRFRTHSQLSGKPSDTPDAVSSGPQQEDWQGELETGVREVIIAPAMAEGIHASEPRTQPGTTAPQVKKEIVVTIANDGSIFYDNDAVTSGQMKARLADEMKQPGEKLPVRIRGDRHARVQTLREVISIFLEAGHLNFQLETNMREASPTAGRRLTGAVPRSADNPLGLNEDIEWKFFDAKRDFRTIQYGLISYCSNNHALPTKLADLNRSHMGDLPKDPFDAGPLRVIIEPTKVVLASVGPDGKWDGGKAINPADPTLAGDVVYELTMETVEQLDLLDKVFQPFLPAMHPVSKRGRMRPASNSDPKRPNIVWGPKVKGLRAALEIVPEKTTYALGDLVGIRFHIQNVSAGTRQLAFTELLQGSGFVAVDEKGKAHAAYNCYELGSWPRLQRRVLKPGEEAVLEYGHVCLGELVNTPATTVTADVTPPDPKPATEGIAISCSVDVLPGRYFLWYDLRLPDTGGSEVLEQDDWRGTVQSGVREIVVAAKPEAGP